MYYSDIKRIPDAKARKRTVGGLKRLRKVLSEQIPPKLNSDSLLLATWNIREFDSTAHGFRTLEPYFYIAEILNRFDLIAVQEVRDGLYPLQRLCKILGSWWDFIVTDVTLGKSGNAERMAFLYDKRKVSFCGLAAEFVLPKPQNDSQPPLQLARTPYRAGVRAGWAYLTLVTVHIYYGTSSPNDPRRLEEIRNLASLVAKHAPNFSCAPQYQPGAEPTPDNLVILGDFNIFRNTDASMKALADAGFKVPEGLQSLPGSNVDKNKHYDQIAYLKSLTRMKPTGKAGIFDFFEHVYQESAKSEYDGEYAGSPEKFRNWRTYQMSDHLPMWVEFAVDDSDAYLDSIV